MDILYLVIPCYNEEEVLGETTSRLIDKLTRMQQSGLVSPKSRILYVDDGSRDKTWEMIHAFHQSGLPVQGVKLSRNRGHQNALLAGLMTAKDHADVVISMDADLQDDIEVLDQFMERYYEGCDIVYGVRSSRETDTFFKRTTALGFYRVMELLGAKTVYNHADYRLMSRRALEGLADYREVNLFLRGIVPMIGYKTAAVEYERGKRFAGESKYPLSKMLNFAIDGITSLSVKPLRFIFGLGVLLLGGSVLAALVILILWLTGSHFSAFPAILISIWATCGINLMAVGAVGEYVGKIYLETKARPRFRIETYLGD